jgi:general secretion pathway protein K
MTRIRRGVALMLVLWLIVLLGTIATGVVAATRSEANQVGNLRARAAGRYAAESGVLAATAQLREILAAARTPAEQAALFRNLDEHFAQLRDVPLGEAHFGVAVLDLNARIDLNAADDLTLIAFFRQFVGGQAATALVNALQDWKDLDDRPRPAGAEAADYARAGSPFRPTNCALRRLDELPRIAGFSDELAHKVAPYVTVHGDGRINVNTAPETVLAAIPRLGSAGARNILSWREGGDVFGSIADVYGAFQRARIGESIAMSTLATTPTRLLIVSRGWEAGRPLTHEVQAVYDLMGGELRLRLWTERDL